MHENIFRIEKGEIIGLEAPTGSGKTTGTVKIMSQSPSFFGNTLFIFPTKIAVDAIRFRFGHSHNIQMVTPKTAISMLIKWDRSYDTIVIDEAHFPSREYFAIYRIIVRLRLHKQFRLILLSATIDRQEMRKHFGDEIEFHKLSIRTKHAIKIHYRDDFICFGPAFYPISHEIIKTMKEYVTPSTKGLCFVATHEQCDKMKKQISNEYKNLDIFSLHGGVEDMEEVKTQIKKSSNYICFTTNIAETAITIPGINLIIDTGIRCIMDTNNNIVHQFCDQASMVQRAGRTGRTCDGIVVRLMSESDFKELPFQEYPAHNFHGIVLQLFNLRVDPVEYLGEYAVQSIEYFRSLNLHVPPTAHLSMFLERCGLHIRNGLILDNFMHTFQNTDPSVLQICILLCLSIVDCYDRKPVQLIYYQERASRPEIVRRIKRHLVYRTDLLITVLNMTLSLFLSEDPKAFAAGFSLNFKTFRDILGRFKNILRIAFPSCKDWRTIAMSLNKNYKKVRIPSEMVDGIRRFFWRQPTLELQYGLNIMRSEEDTLQMDNSIVDYISVGHYERMSSRVIIPFVTKQFGYVSLWTLPPHDYRSDINKLHYNLYEVERLQNIKKYFKKEYGRSMEEILYDVAYRPGFHRAEEQLDDFIGNFL